jgi:hypothetical protein
VSDIHQVSPDVLPLALDASERTPVEVDLVTKAGLTALSLFQTHRRADTPKLDKICFNMQPFFYK